MAEVEAPRLNSEVEFCPGCGLVLDDLSRRLSYQQDDISNLEKELRSKRAQLARAESEKERQLREAPQYAEAAEVLEEWKKLCSPKARELGGKRLENVLARLKGGYSKEELKTAVFGYSTKPFVVGGKRVPEGKRDEWFADAELIFRDPQKVDAGLRMAGQDPPVAQKRAERAAESVLGANGGYETVIVLLEDIIIEREREIALLSLRLDREQRVAESLLGEVAPCRVVPTSTGPAVVAVEAGAVHG